MKYLILLNKKELDEINKIYKSSDNELINNFLKSEIIDLKSRLDQLNPDDFSDIDYSILGLKRKHIQIYVEKIKKDLCYSEEQINLGKLDLEFRTFLFLITYEKKCNFFYNDFWFHTRKKLLIDSELDPLLKGQSFFKQFSKSNLEFFKNVDSYGFKSLNLINDSFKIKTSNELSVVSKKKIEILNNWIDFIKKSKELKIVEISL